MRNFTGIITNGTVVITDNNNNTTEVFNVGDYAHYSRDGVFVHLGLITKITAKTVYLFNARDNATYKQGVKGFTRHNAMFDRTKIDVDKGLHGYFIRYDNVIINNVAM